MCISLETKQSVIKRVKQWMLEMYDEATNSRIQNYNDLKKYEEGGAKINALNDLWKKFTKEFVD